MRPACWARTREKIHRSRQVGHFVQVRPAQKIRRKQRYLSQDGGRLRSTPAQLRRERQTVRTATAATTTELLHQLLRNGLLLPQLAPGGGRVVRLRAGLDLGRADLRRGAIHLGHVS